MTAHAHPTPSQFQAVTDDWVRRSKLIADAANLLGAPGIGEQLSQLGLDLMSAAGMAEQATRASGRHDPTTLSLMLGSVDTRLLSIERAIDALFRFGGPIEPIRANRAGERAMPDPHDGTIDPLATAQCATPTGSSRR
jgi:hypothetical protein